ncbi:MAG: iron-sulfur cluster insertion protein ErpA [Bacillati bacterium ANGP1]|uniref:Iron-sulfur cluster insertion protein ErpA n=1 Tax=Candidatus Segetimicrobium genomatis TaxID=2569760 RepID=A0A537LD22_9BACT|nr:MAG: iron-sulfur cluster insertion protein ErpA [Terrabacteria group bacterium ANGP1]
MITITEQAATKLKELLETQEQPGQYLRLFIQPGGCEGFSYGMGFDAERRNDDQIFERGGVQVLVDPNSLQYLSGAQIDYTKSTFGEGFTVRNPNAVSTCGCGHSFKTRHDAGQAEPCDEATAQTQTTQA